MEIKWRQAEESDVGRLARFRDGLDEEFRYGLLVDFDGFEGVFCAVQTEHEQEEMFLLCEVQEVSN